tara:strand:- start:2498 stop:3547 length:1050 start_codon:yes stop_codon:yes gene_type:complete
MQKEVFARAHITPVPNTPPASSKPVRSKPASSKPAAAPPEAPQSTTVAIVEPPASTLPPFGFPPRHRVTETSLHGNCLRIFNGLLALAHGAFAAAVFLLTVEEAVYPTYRGTVTFNFEDDSWLPVPSAPKEKMSLNLSYVVASFFLITSLFHLWYATLGWNSYKEDILRCENHWRWVEYGLSAPLMALLVAYFNTVSSFEVLLSIVVATATTMFFGHLQETTHIPHTDDAYHPTVHAISVLPHIMGYLPQTLVWYLIMSRYFELVSDLPEASPGPPPFVKYILWSQLAFFWSFGFVQLVTSWTAPKRFIYGEYAYATLSFACKGVLGWLMLFNVLVTSDNLSFFPDESE